MSLVIVLLARQNFKFKPRSALEPGGTKLSLQRLWNARILVVGIAKGCQSFLMHC